METRKWENKCLERFSGKNDIEVKFKWSWGFLEHGGKDFQSE
jgi:hypothetical protein